MPTSRHPLQLNPTLIAARPNDPTLGAAVEVYRRLRSRGRYGYWSWSVVHVLSALRLAGHPVRQKTLPLSVLALTLARPLTRPQHVRVSGAHRRDARALP